MRVPSVPKPRLFILLPEAHQGKTEAKNPALCEPNAKGRRHAIPASWPPASSTYPISIQSRICIKEVVGILETSTKQTEPAIGRISRLAAHGLIALFITLVLGALAVSGIISTNIGHVLWGSAWIAGSLFIFAEAFPNQSLPKKLILSGLLGVLILTADIWILRWKRHQDSRAAIVSLPEPTPPTPSTKSEAGPTVATSRPVPKRPPRREIIVVVTFKDSPLFTAGRKEKIRTELDAYYRYLTQLGLDLPREIPPLGLSPAHGPLMGGGSQGPVYYSSLIVPEDTVDNPAVLRFVYSLYTFNRMLVWPNAYKASISRAEAEDDEVAAQIYACYYPASFSGKSVCGKNGSDHKWTDAMLEVRMKYGQEYTDALMCYTLRMWNDMPPKDVENFDRFFRYKLVAGETVKDNGPNRHRELDEILRKHGIEVTLPQ